MIHTRDAQQLLAMMLDMLSRIGFKSSCGIWPTSLPLMPAPGYSGGQRMIILVVLIRGLIVTWVKAHGHVEGR